MAFLTPLLLSSSLSSPFPSVSSLSFRRRLLLTRLSASRISSRVSVRSVPHCSYDFDVAVIGAGVGGHGAALHAVSKGLRVILFEARDIGGTCVNRGCVPSKALLAAAGRVREMNDATHLESLGISVSGVRYDRQGVADHANGLAARVRGNMSKSLSGLGVTVVNERATLAGVGRVTAGGKMYTVKDVILAPGSVPLVPRGIETDGHTVFTSDEALKMEWVPEWVAIVGSGYIGLEFSDVYTALGSNVTFVEAMPNLMPGFDPEIGRLAQRLLVNARDVDWHTGVFAKKVSPGKRGEAPVVVELMDAESGEDRGKLYVDAAMIATGRKPYTKGLGLETVGVETGKGGFVSVDDRMRVMDTKGNIVKGVYAIGDVNGKMMLAHAASAQGISAVEDIVNESRGEHYVVEHLCVPAACFTHPEISMVGLTEPQAKEKGEKEGFEVGKSMGYFKANSKALAEGEGDGVVKVLYEKASGKLLGVHIIGLHAADLIQECANAMRKGMKVEELAYYVHTHPTLSEVVDEAIKGAVGMVGH